MSVPLNVYEKLGAFYLGRAFDMKRQQLHAEPVLYDSKDLVTHAAIVGMTGSGKTGLGIGLLEEAAIDGIPALVVDPKGDLTNLLLTFPELQPEDFAPWINGEDARRQGLTPKQFAKSQANLWKEGLARWDQDGERIRRLRESADFAIYTPGSNAGLPVSILASFTPPNLQATEDMDLWRDRIVTTVTSLLSLLGIRADPIRSREHILLTTLIDGAWQEGRSLDLAALIHLVQDPPVNRIGVFDIESFYPAKERFELAMLLNNLLASPGFSVWMSGQPLDVDQLLYTPEGKPRVSIFSIAHLSDAERMFFVSLLLSQTLGWMRSRPGTTSLRALLYIDEVFGYMPPVSEPPTKKPLLTLLKQARAYGLGLVLATQNPVDLDYKGLSNTGTWFLGRLQTERDKQRVLDGLEGVSAAAGGAFDRAQLSDVLAGLGKRVFLLHNVHEQSPVTFRTRWTLSYLAGPMTRTQIKTLTTPHKAKEPAHVPTPAATGGSETAQPTLRTKPSTSQTSLSGPAPAPARDAVAASAVGSPEDVPPPSMPAASAPRPVLPAEVTEVFLPIQSDGPSDEVLYLPRLVGMAHVHFYDRRTGLQVDQHVTLLAAVAKRSKRVDWSEATEVAATETDVVDRPPQPGAFGEVPSAACQPKNYTAWKKELANHLYRTRRYRLLRSPGLNELSLPGESERDFRIRLAEKAREQRDMEVEKLRKRFAPRFHTIRERIRKAQLRLEREQQEASGSKLQTAVSFGATLLSAVMGRKRLSSTTISRAATAARGAGRASKQADDVRRARKDLKAYSAKLRELESSLQAEIERIERRFDPRTETLDTCELKPRRSDISVDLVALAWAPYVRDDDAPMVPQVWQPKAQRADLE